MPLAGSSLAALSITRNKGDVDSVLTNFKARLAERGARGIIGLSRRFRSMDDDGSQALSVAEFKKAVNETNIDLTDQVLLPSSRLEVVMFDFLICIISNEGFPIALCSL